MYLHFGLRLKARSLARDFCLQKKRTLRIMALRHILVKFCSKKVHKKAVKCDLIYNVDVIFLHKHLTTFSQ